MVGSWGGACGVGALGWSRARLRPFCMQCHVPAGSRCALLSRSTACSHLCSPPYFVGGSPPFAPCRSFRARAGLLDRVLLHVGISASEGGLRGEHG
eukprot:14043964-Alexandrium_andersonii.AAC.1